MNIDQLTNVHKKISDIVCANIHEDVDGTARTFVDKTLFYLWHGITDELYSYRTARMCEIIPIALDVLVKAEEHFTESTLNTYIADREKCFTDNAQEIADFVFAFYNTAWFALEKFSRAYRAGEFTILNDSWYDWLTEVKTQDFVDCAQQMRMPLAESLREQFTEYADSGENGNLPSAITGQYAKAIKNETESRKKQLKAVFLAAHGLTNAGICCALEISGPQNISLTLKNGLEVARKLNLPSLAEYLNRHGRITE